MQPLRDNRRVLAVPDPLREFVDTPRDFWAGPEVYSPLQISPLVADRDYRLLCDFDWQPGQAGVLFAIGDTFLGLAARIHQDRLEIVHRASPTQARHWAFDLQAGSHCLELVHKANGKRQGVARLILSGLELGEIDTVAQMRRHRSKDVTPMERGAPVFADVAPGDPQVFQGRVHRVRIEPGPQAPGSLANRLESLAQLD